MSSQKTTFLVAILILVAAVLVASLLWKEGATPESVMGDPVETRTTDSDVAPASRDKVSPEPGPSQARRDVIDESVPRWRVEGHVRDPAGRPIAGAEVVGREDGPWVMPVHTDENGFYRVDLAGWYGIRSLSVSRNLSLWLTAWAPGFKPSGTRSVERPDIPAGDELVLVKDLELIPGGSVSGVVRTTSGEVVGGARVELQWEGEDPTVTSSDPLGFFRLPVSRDGLHELLAADGVHGVDVRGDLVLEADGEHTQDMTLVPKSEISGQFVYADGRPIEGLRVMVIPPSLRDDDDPYPTGAARGIMWTGADGRFAFRGLRPGRYRLYLSQVGTAITSASTLKEYYETGQPEQRIVLPLHRLKLTIRDELGEVLDGVMSQRIGWEAEYGPYLRRLEDGVPLPQDVQDAGRMGVGGLVRPGTWWLIRAYHDDYSAWTVVEASRDRNETTVELTLEKPERSAGLRVTVSDDLGNSVPRFQVRLGPVLPGTSYTENGEGGVRSVMLNAPPGDHHLSVRAPRDYLPERRQVRLVAGQVRDVDVVLTRGGRVQFVIRVPDLEDGEVLRGMEIQLDGTDQRRITRAVTFLDNGGRRSAAARNGEQFTHTRALRSGSYRITVGLEGYKDHETVALVRAGESAFVEVYMER